VHRHDQFRIALELPADDELLLVAARERFRLGVGVRGRTSYCSITDSA